VKNLAPFKPAAVLLASVLIFAGCDGKNENAGTEAKTQEYVARAENYRSQGQYRAAIIEVRNALQKNPNDRVATLELASISNELGQGKSALKLLEPIAKVANREEALAIAQSYFLQRKFQSVLDYLSAQKQRLNLVDDAEACLLEARALLRLGRLSEAESQLSKLDASDPYVALEKITAAAQRNEVAIAKSAMDSLLAKYPENTDVLLAAALQAEQANLLETAEDLLSKALIQTPQTDIMLPQKTEILRRLSTTLTKLGRSNEALIYAKTLAEANPQGSLLQDKFKQGLELFQTGKLEEAEPILAEVYKESRNETAGILLGMIQYAKNDMLGAEQYLGSNIDPEVSPETALTTLAATQLRLDQPEKLVALFDKEARGNIKSPELKLLVGIALLQTGEATQGDALIKSAQSDRPNDRGLQTTLARYYLSIRAADKAIAALEPLNAENDAALGRLLIGAYLLDGKSEKALETAKAIASNNPQTAENTWVLGHTALQLQRLDIAETALTRALTQRADFLPAQLDMANLHLRQKHFTPAENIYRAVLKQKPDTLPALQGLLISLKQKGLKDDELEKSFLDDTKSSENGKLVLAEYYLGSRKLQDADRLVNTVVGGESSTYVTQIRQQLTMAHAIELIQSKDYKQARVAIAEGLEAHPLNPALLTLLARIDLQEKKTDDAKKIAAQLHQIAPQSPQTLELLGDLAMLEDNANAQTHYRGAWNKIANDPLGLKLYRSLAKDPKAANAFLSEWSLRIPNSTQAQLLIGISKQQAGDKKGAIADYEAVIARNERDALALNNLAWLYSEINDKRALATAERAAALQPDNPAVLDTHGWILVQDGQKERGIEQLKKALKLAPNSNEIEQHLAKAQSL
jgi:tetratricopeptide (TPR) repeat protein